MVSSSNILTLLLFLFSSFGISELEQTSVKSISQDDAIYIFCYGSLVNEQSRNRTVTSLEVLPVVLRGFTRSWKYPAKKYLALSLKHDSSPLSSTNGLLVAIPKKDLIPLSKREFGYTLVKLNASDIINYTSPYIDEPISTSNLKFPSAEIFTYVYHSSPNEEKRPLALSYIFLVLEGFKSVSDDFAYMFAFTTKRFHPKNVVNDFKWDKPVTPDGKKDFGIKNPELVVKAVLGEEDHY